MLILKILRENYKLTQQDLSKSILIDVHTIKKYESGVYVPTLKNITKYSLFFGFSIDYLINEGITNYPKNLKLLRICSILDAKDEEQIIQLKHTINNFLIKISDKSINYIFDDINAELSNNFHENLKILRKNKNLTQEELGKDFNISKRMIGGYEKNMNPPFDKLLFLAKKLEVSTHCLVTGERLAFNLNDKKFSETILKADQFLNYEDQRMLIQLMEPFLHT